MVEKKFLVSYDCPDSFYYRSKAGRVKKVKPILREVSHEIRGLFRAFLNQHGSVQVSLSVFLTSESAVKEFKELQSGLLEFLKEKTRDQLARAKKDDDPERTKRYRKKLVFLEENWLEAEPRVKFFEVVSG